VKSPPRGEVWLVDLGLAAKIRPCVVLSIAAGDLDRALVTMVPHTTSVRGSKFEVAVHARFLKAGAFDAQGLVTVPHAWLVRPIGTLAAIQLQQVEAAVRAWLGLGDAQA
jgi:mRNA interferase MazF